MRMMVNRIFYLITAAVVFSCCAAEEAGYNGRLARVDNQLMLRLSAEIAGKAAVDRSVLARR